MTRDEMISMLADQGLKGNKMIAAGKNKKSAHLKAFAKIEVAAIATSLTASIRQAAAVWTGTRQEFIAAQVGAGANAATAATQWAKGRKA